MTNSLLVVDPFLICVPQPGSPASEYKRFAGGLVGWQPATTQKQFAICVSDSCTSAMLQDEVYPSEHLVRKLLREHDVGHLPIDMVAKIAQNLIARTPRLEARLEIRDVAYDAQPLCVSPPVFIERLKPNCATAFRGAVVSMATHKAVFGAQNQNLQLNVASVSSAPAQPGAALDVLAQVEAFTNTKDDPTILAPPATAQHSFPVWTSFADFLDAQGPVAILGDCSESETAIRAIDTAVRDLIRSGTPDKTWEPVRHSLTAADIRNLPSLLRKLREKKDAVQIYFHDRLRPSTRKALITCAKPFEPNDALRTMVVDDLNRIIIGPTLWDPKRFKNTPIRQETLDLATAKPSGPAMVRLNRLILEDVYEPELARKLKPYVLGHRFLESLRTWGFDSRSDWAGVLLDSCARILLRQPKHQLKPFRENAHSQKQKVRPHDSALAWRTHLTKENEGFRLMFWELPDRTLEFANVGSKHEEKIL